MGLFTNKKNLCPICGAPTPRLLATKVEDMPICKECDGKIDIPYETVNRMTVEDFRGYLAFYDENAALRACFRNEYTLDVKGWTAEIQIDYTNGLFRLSSQDRGIVFEGSCIRSFRIMEDGHPLYEGNADGMRCCYSTAPDYLEQLRPMYNDYLRDYREYERMKVMVDAMDRDRERDGYRREIPEPRFDVAKPVQQYHIIITMDNPYVPEFRGDIDGPDFSFVTPDLMETAQRYNNLLDSLDVLAQSLMRLFAPNAPAHRADDNAVQQQPAVPVAAPVAVPVAAPAAASAPADAVTELRRFKELLDQGILTEEEFAAKKRQLLGL